MVFVNRVFLLSQPILPMVFPV